MKRIEEMNETEILQLLTDMAVELVPIVGQATWEEQERRGNEPPFVWVRAARVLQAIVVEKNHKIKEQRDQLIEVRKELSSYKKRK